jgi:hypothetical protein
VSRCTLEVITRVDRGKLGTLLGDTGFELVNDRVTGSVTRRSVPLAAFSFTPGPFASASCRRLAWLRALLRRSRSRGGGRVVHRSAAG